MKNLRVVVLMHETLVPPDSIEGLSDEEIQEWKMEYDVVATLRNLGHEVMPLGILDDLGVLRRAISEFKPDIAFNLLEEFNGVGVYDQHIVSYLELMKQPYTGCNPRGLLLAHDKPLAKKILAFHRIRTPGFFVAPIGKKITKSKGIAFPMIVKSVSEEASLGITESSVVYNDESLQDRVRYIHEELRTDALVEEFIDGREMYVGICGNRRLTVFPVWELKFTKAPKGMPQIATAKVKWDYKHQDKLGIVTEAANDLDAALERNIVNTCKRVYRSLSLSGYARIDLRVTNDGRIYVLEANPNPNLSFGEDFAESAEASGLKYEELLQKILQLGLTYQAEWRAVE
ncbi:MAG: ATP-grasp domain-containing protein [Pirellulaceae bacterium]